MRTGTPRNSYATALVVLAALTLAVLQTYAATFDCLFDVVNNDEIARKQAQFLVWDGVSHPLSASFEKVDIIDKNWPFYLFHVVIASPGTKEERDRSSYLVCFRLNEQTTDFRIITVVQYASNPPTESEVMVEKRLNGWPVPPPWEPEEKLPRKIKGSGLSIVLDKCWGGNR